MLQNENSNTTANNSGAQPPHSPNRLTQWANGLKIGSSLDHFTGDHVQHLVVHGLRVLQRVAENLM